MRATSRFIATACAALFLASSAHADATRWSWDSGSVAAGAAITSGIKDTAGAERITCTVDNAGAVARNFTVNFYTDGGVLMFTSTAISVGITTKAAISIAHGATAGNGVSAIPAAPHRKIQIDLAAGGAAAGRVFCSGR